MLVIHSLHQKVERFRDPQSEVMLAAVVSMGGGQSRECPLLSSFALFVAC